MCAIGCVRTREGVLIDASPAEIWAVYANVKEWSTWTASITEGVPLDGDELEVGWRFRIRQPKFPAAVWTVSELTEGRSWTWEALSPGARTAASHVVTACGDGTQVDQRIEQSGPIGALVGRIAAGTTRRYLRMEAEGLAKVVANREVAAERELPERERDVPESDAGGS